MILDTLVDVMNHYTLYKIIMKTSESKLSNVADTNILSVTLSTTQYFQIRNNNGDAWATFFNYKHII